MPPESNSPRTMLRAGSTDELVAHYKATTKLDHDYLEAAIPAAIVALYETRDAGGMMHNAGAAAAVAALEAAKLVEWVKRQEVE